MMRPKTISRFDPMLPSVKAIDILHATVGTVSSREDGSVAFRVITPELRPSEKGEIMSFHGRAVRVLIAPCEGEPLETVVVDTERDIKTPSQRLRGIIVAHWIQEGRPGDCETFYRQRMEAICEGYKTKNLQPI